MEYVGHYFGELTMCVHTSHCCKDHGCKYGDSDCPVETGRLKQEYPCEMCSYEEREHRYFTLQKKQQLNNDVNEQDHF